MKAELLGLTCKQCIQLNLRKCFMMKEKKKKSVIRILYLNLGYKTKYKGLAFFKLMLVLLLTTTLISLWLLITAKQFTKLS